MIQIKYIFILSLLFTLVLNLIVKLFYLNINNLNINLKFFIKTIKNTMISINLRYFISVVIKIIYKIIKILSIIIASVQYGIIILGRTLNYHISNNLNKFWQLYLDNNHFSNFIDNNITNLYPNFPLNLLPDLDQLATAEFMFLIVLININIVNYISELNIIKYLPDNKIGKILNLIINRYIAIWKNTSKYLIIISYIGLFFCIIISKIGFYYILTPKF